MRRRPLARAFSLLEMVIATGLLLAVLFIVSIALNVSGDQARYDLAYSEASSAARSLLQQISRELASSGGDGSGDYVSTHPYAATSSGTAVEFQMRQDLALPASTWSSAIRYQLQASAGETAGDNDDDDRDGVIDEQSLVRIQDGQTVAIDDSITFFQVDRTAQADTVTVTVEVSRGYERKKVVTQASESVRVRLSRNIMLLNRP